MAKGTSNKSLRILIADTQFFSCMRLERKLNSLGYFRIVPVYAADDFLALIDGAWTPFDVVIASALLTRGTNFDIMHFCSNNKYVHNALIYGCSQAHPRGAYFVFEQKVLLGVESDPDYLMIREFMSAVD